MKRGIVQVGVSQPRVDAKAKAGGREKYAADYYGPDLLWAGVKRAHVPHARLRGVETAEALALPGVAAVLTSADVKGSNRQGVIKRDQPVLVDDKVRYCGDAVALVVAQDREILARALGLIHLDYEELPGIFDPLQALQPGSPLVHEDHASGNLLLEGCLQTGRGEAALAECAAVVEADYDLPYQEHAYLETESGWARLEGGRLTVVASTQTPFRDRAEMAEALGLRPDDIRIIAPHAGGAFGGKDGITVQSLLGLAALACPGRAVKMWWSREESFLVSAKRHPASLRYRLGAQADGTLHALAAEFVFDTGPYDHLGGAVLTLGLEHAGGPYRIPHASLHGRAVYTNNALSGAFRGFGVPQVALALEQTLDLLAARLGLDPLELRLRNALGQGERTPAGVTLTGSVGLQECLAQVAAHPLWRERRQWREAAGPFKRRGMGVAAVMHAVGYGPVVPDVAQAKLELTLEGRFRVYAGVVDMGQGNTSTYVQLAAQALGQDAANMELVLPDTDRTLPSGSASASRTTYAFGNALLGAAQTLKDFLVARAADLLMVAQTREMALLPGVIRHLPSGREVDLARLAGFLDPAQRVATYHWRAPVSQERPSQDEALRLHGLPHCVYSFGAHLAAVEVDELTGRVHVERYLAVSDCGRILNPQLLEQQIEGGVVQGLGFALYEDYQVTQGQGRTPDLATYILPTSLDVPMVESSFVQTYEESGPLGLKGAGEVAVDAPAPAVANAVAQACGARIPRLPLTPERVLAALNAQTTAGERP